MVRARVTRSLSKTTSYSASLFETLNENLTAWAINKPSGDCNTIPALPLSVLEDPSVLSIHKKSKRST